LAELLLTNRAKSDLEALPRAFQEAVVETLTVLAARPEELGKELRGRLRGLWSCRIGNYRVLYTIEKRGRGSRVIVRAIRHRAIAYRTRRGRRSP
jgi:mRNA-degrading endonuclease RelE of RelBE toxin-antitoxin system